MRLRSTSTMSKGWASFARASSASPNCDALYMSVERGVEFGPVAVRDPQTNTVGAPAVGEPCGTSRQPMTSLARIFDIQSTLPARGSPARPALELEVVRYVPISSRYGHITYS